MLTFNDHLENFSKRPTDYLKLYDLNVVAPEAELRDVWYGWSKTVADHVMKFDEVKLLGDYLVDETYPSMQGLIPVTYTEYAFFLAHVSRFALHNATCAEAEYFIRQSMYFSLKKDSEIIDKTLASVLQLVINDK